MNLEQFYQELEKYQISLDDNQKKQFETYYELLVEWNKKINLTAITEKNEVYLKHFFDSILLGLTEKFNEEITTLCDVGAGAGFPSIPLKIVYPNLEITIVDSLNKRILFLQELTQTLGLKNVHLYHDRAETFGQNKKFRETFDYVTARAVARLNILSELCIPLLKKDGLFLALKASKMQEEVEEAKVAIALLGGKLLGNKEYKLPLTGDLRHIVMIQKKKETPKKYPRKPGTPAKQPLIEKQGI